LQPSLLQLNHTKGLSYMLNYYAINALPRL